jgi:RHS repeat-associated protein
MGTSSARPSELEQFASRSRRADDQVQTHERRLRTAYGEFLSGTEWGVLDIRSMLAGLHEWLNWNEIDARWVARIAATFRAAGGDGAIKTLPDAAIHASLKAAGLLGGRQSITFDDPVAYGFPPTSGYTNDPVNTASGNFVEEETDLPFSGLLTGLRFGRVYNSRSDRAGAFGPGWSSWADARLRFVADGAAYEGPDGQRALFPRQGDGYGRVLGVGALAEPLPGGGIALAWFSGERWEFDDAGLPVRVTRGPGTDIRLQHDDDRLVGLAHAGGARVRVDWDGERIAGLLGTDGRRVTYRYDGAGNLVAAGGRAYEIDDDGYVASVLDADGVAEVVNAYDEDGRVIAQLSPFGRLTQISYLPGAVTVTTDEQGGPDNIYVHDEHGRVQAVIDGEGARLSIDYDEWGNPVAVTDRNGAVTVKEWDERAQLVRTAGTAGSEFAFAHDDRGRVVEVAERSSGAVTRYGYDAAERTPSEVTDPEGGVTRMTVQDGLVERIVDPDGVELAFEFDADGNIVASIDADGNAARVERDAAGLPVAAVTPLGHRTTFTYDDDGRLLAREDPAGGVWRYEYTAAGRPTALIDPTGGREEIRYDEHGLATATVDPAGHVLEHRYDALGNVVGTVAADGAAWEFAYDGVCRLTSMTDPSGATWRREYDADGNLVAAVDPAGARLSATVDPVGRVTQLADGLTSASFSFDALGRVRASARPDGSETHTEYDRCGRAIAVRDPAGGTTRIEYTAAGRVRRVIAPSGRVESTFEYDRCGRLAARIDGAGRRWEYHYDADRSLVAAVAPTGEAERFAYDAAGRLVEWSAPGRGVTSYAHDGAGRIVAVTDRAAGARRFAYDGGGRLVEATDANGATTRYAYDQRGALIEVTDPLGGTSTRAYDASGRLVSETDPLGRTTSVAYDPAGRVVERADAAGRTLRWSYEPSGRLHSYGPVGEEPTTIHYDDLGRAVRIDEPGAFAHRLRYDSAGRLVERRRGDLAVRWRYSEDGDRLAFAYPDGSEARYTYDDGGLLAGISHPALGAIALERDLAGRMIAARGAGMRATWGFEGGELATYELWAGEATRAARLERDPIGRVVAATVDGARRRFSYDAAGQLVSAGDATLAYDAGGRLVRERGTGGEDVTYEYDAAGQLLARRPARGAATTYEYDGAGLRVREAQEDGASRVYRWDAQGRLAAIERGDHTTRVAVDALGELATVGGTALMWDTADPLSPLTWIGDRAVIGLGAPWATAAGGEATWLAPDWQGTVGAPRDPWGAATAATPPAGPQLGYRGELEFDAVTWLRNRVYDAGSRAFLQPDPLPHVPGTPSAANPYHYAANNPIGLVDPLGLRPVTDQQLRDIRDSMGRDIFEKAADWTVDNWEYIAAGAMVVGGIALMCTGVGGPAGLALMAGGSGLVSAGASVGIQKLTTGEVNWGEVAVQGAIGVAAGGVGYGAGALVAGTSRAAAVGRGAVGGGVESIGGGMANRGLHGGNAFDVRAMGADALVGVGGGGAGGAFAARRGTTLSGHGDWSPGQGHLTVPEGTTVTFHGTHGTKITDPLGNAIETRQLDRVPMTEVYGPGSHIPDYRLHAPDGLNIMDRPRSLMEPLSYMTRSKTVDEPTALSAMLHPHMGNVEWAACRYVPGHPQSGYAWDVTH